MEEKDIDILIGMLEDGIDGRYDEEDDISYFNFKREYEYSSEIKSLLDKIGVKYDYDLDDEILTFSSGEEPKIKDWLKENSKKLMDYIKTKDKKTIGKFALIFGEALDEDLLKEIINSYKVVESDFYNYNEEYNEFGLDSYQRGKILSFVKDPEYLKYVFENRRDFNLSIDNSVYIHILKNISDINQIKDYIERLEPHNNYDIVKLVTSINDPEYTKQVINDREKYGIDVNDIILLVTSINDPEYTKQVIDDREKYGLDGYYIATLVESIKDPEYTKKITEDGKKYGLDGYCIATLVESIKDPEYTKKIIEDGKLYGIDVYNIVDLLKYLNDPEYTKRIIEDGKLYGIDSYNIVKLLKYLNEPEYGKNMIKRILENVRQYGIGGYYNIVNLLEYLNEPEYTNKMIKRILEDIRQYGIRGYDDIVKLLKYLNEPEYGKNIIKRIIGNKEQYNINESEIKWLIRSVNDQDFIKDCIKDCIKNRKNYKLSAEYIASWAFENVNEEELFELIDKEVSEIYREKYASIEAIKENLSKFLEIEGVSIVKDVLLQMSEKNEGILKGNFDILDDRYINILGPEKVNQISCYSDIANKVLGLSDEELLLLGKILDKYMDITKGEEWTPLANRILENIGSYKELVSNLEENENINIDKLIPILIHSNNFDIKTIEDVENFQEIKRKKCKELINGETVEEKQKGVLLKIFGQGMRETKKIIAKFGEDIDEIEDEDLKAYIKSLQEILKTKNPKVLEEIYEQVGELETINPLLMERMLKTEYCKLYNKDLFNVKNAEKLPDGENIYSAGTDFKMIITSVGAYHTNSVTDYRKDWNRPQIGSQHFCASYIRNDMIGHAPILHICYGFNEMKEDSLMLSGPSDVYSSGVSFESTARRNERYLAPNNQIANTNYYNEMDFRRIQEGEKKQPDYIVVFRKDGKIPNMDKAQKASEDFGGLPIVVIDVDECLTTERKKAEELFEEYKKTKDPQVGIKLREKLRNNRVTDFSFCVDTEMDRVLDSLKEQEKKEEQNVSIEDLEEIYREVSGKERQEETEKIKMVYERIKIIKGRKDDNDAR